MSDKFSCRLHPKGRCGSVVPAYNVGSEKRCTPNGYVLQAHDSDIFEACPFPSRQIDPPKRMTYLEKAVSIYKENADLFSDKVFCKQILVGLGIDPDKEMEE